VDVSFVVGDVAVDLAGNIPVLITKVHEYADPIVNNQFRSLAYTVMDASGKCDYVKDFWLQPHPEDFVARVFKAHVEEKYLGKV
jgi:hypothetical protein